MPTPLKTQEQERASKAWELVKSVQTEDFREEYQSWVKKLPSLILTNGLAQTVAYLCSKKGDRKEFKAIYLHLSKWLLRKVDWTNYSEELIECIITNNTTTYRYATVEALAFVQWLRRFADALIFTDSQDGQGGSPA